MKASVERKSPEFKPISITITLESAKQLREFLEATGEPWCSLGYDCLYDTVHFLENEYLLWRRQQKK